MFKKLKKILSIGNKQDEEHNTAEDQDDNLRYDYRVYLDPPLCADMRIARVKGKLLENTNSSKVCVLDISGGGLRFATNFDFPLEHDYFLHFTLTILDKKRILEGQVTRKQEVDDHFEYGVKFKHYGDKDELVKYVNRLQVKLNKQDTLPKGCSFCDIENTICYKNPNGDSGKDAK